MSSKSDRPTMAQVMDLIYRHLAPLYGGAQSFTLIVCHEEGQSVTSNDPDIEELLEGLLAGMQDDPGPWRPRVMH